MMSNRWLPITKAIANTTTWCPRTAIHESNPRAWDATAELDGRRYDCWTVIAV
jgi:hypothetical protein